MALAMASVGGLVVPKLSARQDRTSAAIYQIHADLCNQWLACHIHLGCGVTASQGPA